MQPTQKNNKLPNGWKVLIASLSVTSFVGLMNLFSGRDVKSVNSQVLDTLLDTPMPTLVPVVNNNNVIAAPEKTPAAALREVSAPASATVPPKQKVVIEQVFVGGSSSSSGGFNQHIFILKMLKIKFRAMGCQIEAITASESDHARDLLGEVPGWFEEWEQTLSRFMPDSELTQLNFHPETPVSVSETLWEVFCAASDMEKESGGLGFSGVIECPGCLRV